VASWNYGWVILWPDYHPEHYLRLSSWDDGRIWPESRLSLWWCREIGFTDLAGKCM